MGIGENVGEAVGENTGQQGRVREVGIEFGFSAPVITNVAELDSALTVSWSHIGNANYFEFFDNGVSTGVFAGGADRIKTLPGLVNGQEYIIGLKAYENVTFRESELSNEVAGTPTGAVGTPPYIASISGVNGSSTLTVSFSEEINSPTSNYETGMAFTINAVSKTLTYVSGASTNILTYTSETQFSSSDALRLVYTDSVGNLVGVSSALQLDDSDVSFNVVDAGVWRISSNFETGTLGRQADDSEGDLSGFGWTWTVEDGGRTVFSDENPHSGNQSAKCTVTAGSTGWGEWGEFTTHPALGQGDELWFRAWIYYPTNWVHDPGGSKGMRVHIGNAGAMPPRIDIFPKPTNIFTQNAIDFPAYYANNNQNANGEMNDYPQLSGWECVEMYVYFHSVQGIYRSWRNGNLWFEDTQTPTLVSSSDYCDKTSIFTLYANSASPVTQSTFLDDVVVTNGSPGDTDASGNPFIGLS